MVRIPRGRGQAASPPESTAWPANRCPAKTLSLPSGQIVLGRSVLQHCQIVGAVAAELLARIPTGLRTALFPAGSELVAACHDVGKVSPTFTKKLLTNTTDWQPAAYPQFQALNHSLESQWGGHAGVSELTLGTLDIGPYCAEIVGQHHGFSPQVSAFDASGERFGGPGWQQARLDLVAQLKTDLNVDWPNIGNYAQAQAIAGLTSVADWIGSGEYFEDPTQDWQPRISKALDAIGFMPAQIKPGLSFQDLFKFRPRPVQSQLIEQANKPGVYILEAPMGLGKTEAALYAAYQLMASKQACGIYFALPTQLTSNKIYQRFNDFLRRVLQDDCPHRQALLLHGNAWLLEDADMGEEGRPGSSWFSSAKRGLLAPFAVGTIDQALMATMNVRHGFVRTFGLAGKVVILDEVHSYDAYTGTILDALVNTLCQLHCTVIILSATLSAPRRQQLLSEAVSAADYPLITAQPLGQPLRELSVDTPADGHSLLLIKRLTDDARAMDEALDRAEQGQQVLWIENTVKEAQQRYLDLAANCAAMGVDCGLLHSRFSAEHRQHNEDDWVNRFGKPGWPERPLIGRILVGTQVLEQSLDIDADFLVSRFAPTDMLLQRLGRLWRHRDAPRPDAAHCEAWILAPALDAAIAQPQTAFGASAWVYSPYVLCRSLEVWQGYDQLSLPADIRPLIDATYTERPEQGEMARWLHELREGNRNRIGQRALTQLARLTLAQSGKALPESRAQTRYSEGDNAEVLLLASLTLNPEEKASQLVLLDGSTLTLPWQRQALSWAQWRKLSAQLMRQIIKVRFAEAPQALNRALLKKTGLQHCFYLGDASQDEALLRLALVDDCDALQGYQQAPLNSEYMLSYCADLGYSAQKIKE